MTTTTQATGPQPGEQVWMSIARKGIDAHRVIPSRGRTGCGRPTRTGLTMPATQAAEQYQAGPCRRCWPDQTP